MKETWQSEPNKHFSFKLLKSLRPPETIVKKISRHKLVKQNTFAKASFYSLASLGTSLKSQSYLKVIGQKAIP